MKQICRFASKVSWRRGPFWGSNAPPTARSGKCAVQAPSRKHPRRGFATHPSASIRDGSGGHCTRPTRKSDFLQHVLRPSERTGRRQVPASAQPSPAQHPIKVVVVQRPMKRQDRCNPTVAHAGGGLLSIRDGEPAAESDIEVCLPHVLTDGGGKGLTQPE